MTEDTLMLAAKAPGVRPTSIQKNPHGLKFQVLSPVETLAQSVSSIAPTASPMVVIPLVYGVSGPGTWLAYLLATAGVVFIALCVNEFTRCSASPGSLYSYVSASLGRSWGLTAGWSLLAAYATTAAAVTGGFTNYTNVLLQETCGKSLSPVLLTCIPVALAWAAAYRNVQLSARFMVWLEGCSVVLMGGLTALFLLRRALHGATIVPSAAGLSYDKVRMGLVLATFSFVGFESAASLGAEARQPLQTIPRAVLWSAILVGAFFVLCAHGETLAFIGEPVSLDRSTAPMHVLAVKAGLPVLGPLLDAAAVASFFACILACITAGARVLFAMGLDGAVHRAAGKTHESNKTPHHAVTAISLLALAPAAALSLANVSPFDIYGWLGTFATYGFIVVYLLVAIGSLAALRHRNQLKPWHVLPAAIGILTMLTALAGSVYPTPAAPYNWLPAAFVAYLALGLSWFTLVGRSTDRPIRLG